MNLRQWLNLLRQTAAAWRDDGGVRMAAALAYYALFSLAPLAVIGVAVVGGLLTNPDIRARLLGALHGVVGSVGLNTLEQIIQQAPVNPDAGIAATVLSVGVVIFGTTRLFQHLKGALNFIWKVAPYRPTSLRGIVWRQFVLFLAIGAVSLALIALLAATAIIRALEAYLTGLLPAISPLWEVVNLLASFGITAVLIAVIYRIVPDVQIAWRDVWIGAAFTAALLVIGQYLIGLYLTYIGIGSVFGAAGSIIVLLIWVNLSAQILLLGAEFTQVYAHQAGRPIQPDANAVQMIRHTIVEHQMALDEVERELEAELDRIRAEADAMTERAAAGEPSIPPRQRFLRRAASVGSYVASFATGFILGILGVKRRVL